MTLFHTKKNCLIVWRNSSCNRYVPFHKDNILVCCSYTVLKSPVRSKRVLVVFITSHHCTMLTALVPKIRNIFLDLFFSQKGIATFCNVKVEFANSHLLVSSLAMLITILSLIISSMFEPNSHFAACFLSWITYSYKDCNSDCLSE